VPRRHNRGRAAFHGIDRACVDARNAKSGRGVYDLEHRLGHTSVKTAEVYLCYLIPDETGNHDGRVQGAVRRK
jgi:hypothetical protein